MLDNVELLGHSTIKFTKDWTIYFDPFNIKDEKHDADFIFCTHAHYDHFSPRDIEKVMNEYTVIITVEDKLTDALKLGFKNSNIYNVKPDYKFDIRGVKFITTYAYNKEKMYHPKENEWVGYVIDIQGIKYYIAGDTDFVDEAKNVKCDVAFLPVGGTYTMDSEEAASMANFIKPKIAVPIHYGSIVGTAQDAQKFVRLLDSDIKGKIMM